MLRILGDRTVAPACNGSPSWFVKLRRLGVVTLMLGGLFFSSVDVGPAGAAGLSGHWRGVEGSLLGTMATDVIFFPDGTYSRSHRLGNLMTRDTGTYQLVQNWIHFRLQNWGPTEYMGKPLSWPTSDTWVVTNFNGRVLETANMHLERVQ